MANPDSKPGDAAPNRTAFNELQVNLSEAIEIQVIL